MVLVSHIYDFVYQKTFKTAGTSVEMALEPLCAPVDHVVSEATPAIISDSGIVGARRGPAKTDTTGWTPHLSAAATQAKLGSAAYAAATKIAVLRDPFDKAISWFYWMRPRSPVDPDTIVTEFRAFLAAREAENWFGSPHDLDLHTTHIGGVCVIDTWLRFETLRAGLDVLAANWNVAPLHLPVTKARPRKADTLPITAYFDTASIDIMRRHQAWMFAAGNYDEVPRDCPRGSAQVAA